MVSSPFDSRRHLVAVQPDLNDLEDKLSWCQEHPQQCEAIAHEGQQLAIQVLEDLGADVLRRFDQLPINWPIAKKKRRSSSSFFSHV